MVLGNPAVPKLIVVAIILATLLGAGPAPAGAQPSPTPNVLAVGDAPFHGSTEAQNAGLVDLAATPTGQGYRQAGADGGIFAYGDAPFLGSLGGLTLNQPIVAMAATPTGAGYWLAGADGGIFAYGDAPFLGSLGGLTLNQPIVAMAATPTGAGYWLAGADGGIFAYGDAPFLGSLGGLTLNQPIVAMAATPTGAGYWLAGADGGIFALGDAPFLGRVSSGARVTDLAVHPSGGYWVTDSRGNVSPFGGIDVPGRLAVAIPEEAGPVQAITTAPSGDGYWLATTGTVPPCRDVALGPITTGVATGTTGFGAAVLPVDREPCRVDAAARMTLRRPDGTLADVAGNPSDGTVSGVPLIEAVAPSWGWTSACHPTAIEVEIAVGGRTTTRTFGPVPCEDTHLGRSGGLRFIMG